MALLGKKSQSKSYRRSSADIKRRFEEGSRATLREVGDYWLVRAFLANEQWVHWSALDNRLEDIQLSTLRDTRIEANKMLTSKLGRSSRLTSRPYRFEVRPNSSSDKDVFGAKTCEGAIVDLAQRQEWEEKVRPEFVDVLLTGGFAVLCQEWDPFAGDPVIDPSTGSAAIDPVSGRKVGQGDVTTTVLSPAEIVTAPGVVDLEKALWWIKVSTMTPEEAQDKFKLAEKPRATAALQLSPVQRKVMFRNVETSSALARLVTVLTYFERPNVDCPEGCVAVMVGDEVVQESAWYFPFRDRLNVAYAGEVTTHERWTSDSTLRAAIVPQMALNASLSALIEHAKTVGGAKVVAPAFSLDQNAQTQSDAPGDVIYYTGDREPKWMAPPQLSQFMIEMPGLITSILDELLSTQPVTRGDLPPNVEAAQAIAILAENADTPLAPTAKAIARAFARHATNCAEIYEALATEEREATVEMPGLPPRKVSWSGRSFNNNTRVTIPQDAVLPRSRAAQEAFAWNAQRAWGFTPEVFSRVAGLDGADDLTYATNSDAAKAREENYRMSLGEEIIPAIFDNDAVHIQEHNAYRRTSSYEQSPPEIRRLHDLHCAAHEQFALQKVVRQFELAAMNPILALAPRSDAPTFLSPEAQQMIAMFAQPPMPAVEGGGVQSGPDSPSSEVVQ